MKKEIQQRKPKIKKHYNILNDKTNQNVSIITTLDEKVPIYH